MLLNLNVAIILINLRHLLMTQTVKHISRLHTRFCLALSWTHAVLAQMLEVQIICPVQQVNHDERQWEGDSGVVVYVVGVLHMTAVYGAEHFAEGDQSSEAPVGGLRWRCLGLGLTA